MTDPATDQGSTDRTEPTGRISRRSAFAVGAGALAAGISACSSDSPTAGSSSAPPTNLPSSPAGNTSAAPISESTAASSPAASGVDSAGESTATGTHTGADSSSEPAGSTSAAVAPVGEELAAVDAIAEGACLVANKVLLYREGSQVTAFSAICTHKACEVKAQAAQAVCPCHGSIFDGKTGAVQTGPATEALPPVIVTVADGKVYKG